MTASLSSSSRETSVPRQHNQDNEAEAGQHLDILFCLEPAHCLNVKEEPYHVIDEMGKHCSPQAFCPVVQVAEEQGEGQPNFLCVCSRSRR